MGGMPYLDVTLTQNTPTNDECTQLEADMHQTATKEP